MSESDGAIVKAIALVLPADAASVDDILAGFMDELASGERFLVDVPLHSVGRANSYLDLVDDFGDASWICERLGMCADDRNMRWAKDGHTHVIRLELGNYRPRDMAIELARAAIWLDYPNVEVESLRDEYEQAMNDRYEFSDSLSEAQLFFPEIADHYLGNLVMGAYHEWDEPEVLKEELRLHPERRFGFFISRSIQPDGKAVLSSDGELIVPSGASLDKVLESAGYGDEELLPAKLVMTELEASFVGDHDVVGVRADIVVNAIACGDDFVRRTMHEPDSHDLLTFQGRMSTLEGGPSAFIGELSGCASLRCVGFTLLFFDSKPVIEVSRAEQADRVRALEVGLRDGGDSTAVVNLAWDKLDDELFEQLCWDYLYASPLFDRERIEKIGKSRSRDGGRDIVAWTKRAPPMYSPPVKYIFQCKHIDSSASLTPKHIRSIGDIIEQHDAGGYGVMCCGYIDATLHDRIDKIGAGRGTDIRKIDRFQLERFLSRRPKLVKKYFGVV